MHKKADIVSGRYVTIFRLKTRTHIISLSSMKIFYHTVPSTVLTNIS